MTQLLLIFFLLLMELAYISNGNQPRWSRPL